MSSKRKAEAGHRDHFGSPAGKGWPTFGPDGKIVKPAAPAVKPCPCGASPCREIDGGGAFYVEPCRAPFSPGGVCVKPTCSAKCRWAEKP